MEKVTRDMLRRYNELNRQKKAIEKEMDELKEVILNDGRTVFPFYDFMVKLVPAEKVTVSYKELVKVAPEIAEKLAKRTAYKTIKFTGC